jgi:hypothetical protein
LGAAALRARGLDAVVVSSCVVLAIVLILDRYR